MDIFTKYNRKAIHDRQIDTLVGISKGIIANGNVDQAEAVFIQNWLIQNSQAENPIIINLLNKVSEMLEDGVLDSDESAELLNILHSFSGEKTTFGEVSKTTTLPVCNPPPQITFKENNFLFTGTCAYGTRNACQAAIESLGGLNAKSVTKSLNYLILGTYVTDSWAHESFGRKIEKAIEYRNAGLPIAIITEAHWLEECGL